MHLFFYEGLFAIAFYAHVRAAKAEKVVVSLGTLLTDVHFLAGLLDREHVSQFLPIQIEDLHLKFQQMLQFGVFTLNQNQSKVDNLSKSQDIVAIARSGEMIFSFLCALLWPFVDSYYVSASLLFSLQPSKQIDSSVLLPRAQWLASSLYHDRMLCSYESCSNETLRNAFSVLEAWKVIRTERVVKSKGKQSVIVLLPTYQNEEALIQLVERIDYFRKPPPVMPSAKNRQNMVADMPIFAKL